MPNLYRNHDNYRKPYTNTITFNFKCLFCKYEWTVFYSMGEFIFKWWPDVSKRNGKYVCTCTDCRWISEHF